MHLVTAFRLSSAQSHLWLAKTKMHISNLVKGYLYLHNVWGPLERSIEIVTFKNISIESYFSIISIQDQLNNTSQKQSYKVHKGEDDIKWAYIELRRKAIR